MTECEKLTAALRLGAFVLREFVDNGGVRSLGMHRDEELRQVEGALWFVANSLDDRAERVVKLGRDGLLCEVFPGIPMDKKEAPEKSGA